MLTNSEVTLFRYDSSADDYIKTGTFSAWVYRKRESRNTENGRQHADTFHIRIAPDSAADIRTDDLAVLGSAVKCNLKECMRISCVTVNSCGSAPHIHMEAE